LGHGHSPFRAAARLSLGPQPVMKNGAALSLSSGGDRRRCWTEHQAAQSERIADSRRGSAIEPAKGRRNSELFRSPRRGSRTKALRHVTP
jgi:hypothetical protein